MSRKETESEREIAAKWKDVTKAKEAYNEAILPEPDKETPPRKQPGETTDRR